MYFPSNFTDEKLPSRNFGYSIIFLSCALLLLASGLFGKKSIRVYLLNHRNCFIFLSFYTFVQITIRKRDTEVGTSWHQNWNRDATYLLRGIHARTTGTRKIIVVPWTRSFSHVPIHLRHVHDYWKNVIGVRRGCSEGFADQNDFTIFFWLDIFLASLRFENYWFIALMGWPEIDLVTGFDK